jgi:hypothetical protein
MRYFQGSCQSLRNQHLLHCRHIFFVFLRQVADNLELIVCEVLLRKGKDLRAVFFVSELQDSMDQISDTIK